MQQDIKPFFLLLSPVIALEYHEQHFYHLLQGPWQPMPFIVLQRNANRFSLRTIIIHF
jgi:hypothetical protein